MPGPLEKQAVAADFRMALRRDRSARRRPPDRQPAPLLTCAVLPLIARKQRNV